MLGSEDYVFHPFEQRTITVDTLLPRITLQDGTATIRATSGPGRVVAAGARLDGATGDSTTFEMSYDAGPPLIKSTEWIPFGFAALICIAIGLSAAIDRKTSGGHTGDN